MNSPEKQKGNKTVADFDNDGSQYMGEYPGFDVASVANLQHSPQEISLELGTSKMQDAQWHGEEYGESHMQSLAEYEVEPEKAQGFSLRGLFGF